MLNKYFDKEYYLNKYPDIKNSSVDPKEHFINHGSKELREPCDLSLINWNLYIKNNNNNTKTNNNNKTNDITEAKYHFIRTGIFNNLTVIDNNQIQKLNTHEKINEINEINNNLVNYKYDSNKDKYKFDINYYKKYNEDLVTMTNTELIKHFLSHGHSEKRLFCEPLNDFDFDFYLKTNLDIKLNNINYNNIKIYAWKHYLYHGYFEGKTYNKDHKNNYMLSNQSNGNQSNGKVTTINGSLKYNTLVIYVYYNRPGEYKNETNMAFFIEQTIKKRNSIKDSLEFLFIINNHFTELNFPKGHNVHVIKNNNCMDFEAYLMGIRYMETKYSNKIYNMYENVMFMNCSCTGPFTKNNNFWLKPFYDKLNKDTVCCTSILTLINNNSYISGPQIPGYCFIINSKFIDLLIKPNNICIGNRAFSNTVLGQKKSKLDCIISGEHCISLVLFKNNLNIAGLCNQNLDYRNKQNHNNLIFSADRNPVFKHSIYTSIFIKNHWRIDNNSRDSYPVLWSQTKREIEILSNINFINYSMNNLNYNLLNISPIGNIVYNKSKWNSIQDFGRLFADSEELIVFPNSNCSKTINYYHKKSIIGRYTIESIKALLSLNYKVIFYTSINNPFKFRVPTSIEIVNNLSISNINDSKNLGSDLLFPCSDFNTFQEELENKNYDKSIIKIDDYLNNKEKYYNNKYINFLTMYF